MRTKANIELHAGRRTFATGLLVDLIAALKRCHTGDLITITSNEPTIAPDIDAWCRFTGNTLIETNVDATTTRWVIRCGAAPANLDVERSVGSRLWLYSNFDCNLSCDYCCVRSSPSAPRRELGLARVQQIASEAPALGVSEIFVTGGEPFLLANIGEVLAACAASAPTTVLTNGMLFAGRQLAALVSLPRDRVTIQISLDSATPERHDAHRGRDTWVRAWAGVERARSEGFRVRLAATVSTDAEAKEFREFLDAQRIAEEDRVIRHIALRGFASQGVALARADLVPEVTITAEGVYWHPVGAEDADFLVSREIFPLADSFAAVRRAFDHERDHSRRLATIFNCA
jgi:organic radical activating enzyme/TusA-related sulfurtransferase